MTLYTSFHDLINVYNRRSGADNPRGQNFDVNRNLLSHLSFATSFKKISLKDDFIHFFFMDLYMFIAPGQGLTTPWGRNFDVNRNSLSLRSFAASFKKIFLKSDLIHFFFMILYMYIAPGQWQTTPRGQSFGVNRNVLSLHSFVASLKRNVFEVWFYSLFFHNLIHIYSPGVGGIQPQGDKVLISTETSCHSGHLLLVSNHRRQ